MNNKEQARQTEASKYIFAGMDGSSDHYNLADLAHEAKQLNFEDNDPSCLLPLLANGKKQAIKDLREVIRDASSLVARLENLIDKLVLMDD